MKAIEYITAEELIKLEKEKRAIGIYRRKLEIVIDGWKRYKITKEELQNFEDTKQTN